MKGVGSLLDAWSQPIDKVKYLAGIGPNDIWREVATKSERLKASVSYAYLLFGYHPAPPILELEKVLFPPEHLRILKEQQWMPGL